jgi:hypothetical protein
MNDERTVCEKLKRMGYGHKARVRMYGEEFELVSDPRFIGKHLVVVDAIEQRSQRVQRVCLPLMLVQMVEEELDVK